MRLLSIASGSSGNCIYVGDENTHILIDAGISGKKVETGLKSIGLSAADLHAVFITHEHIDHIKGAGVLSRRYDLPLYANAGTWSGMESKIGKIKEKKLHPKGWSFLFLRRLKHIGDQLYQQKSHCHKQQRTDEFSAPLHRHFGA